MTAVTGATPITASVRCGRIRPIAAARPRCGSRKPGERGGAPGKRWGVALVLKRTPPFMVLPTARIEIEAARGRCSELQFFVRCAVATSFCVPASLYFRSGWRRDRTLWRVLGLAAGHASWFGPRIAPSSLGSFLRACGGHPDRATTLQRRLDAVARFPPIAGRKRPQPHPPPLLYAALRLAKLGGL